MKKIVTVVLMMLMLITMTGCSAATEPAVSVDGPDPEIVRPSEENAAETKNEMDANTENAQITEVKTEDPTPETKPADEQADTQQAKQKVSILHIHNWEAVYKTVHHPAETHTVHHDAVTKIVHHDAEYKTVHHDAEYTQVWHDGTGHYEYVCHQCGARFLDYNAANDHLEGSLLNGGDCISWYGDWIYDSDSYYENVLVKEAWDETVLAKAAYDETVVVKAAYDEVIVDKEAWDEEVISGYRCSCGATK